MNALPAACLGTLLDNDSFRVAVALRLGAPLCSPHVCRCGQQVSEDGAHGLSCRLSAGRLSRHSAVNDLIKRALVTAGVPSILEPSGVSRNDGKRPDGMSIFPWSRGKALIWDFTCVDTLAPSRLRLSCQAPGGSTAAEADRRKIDKYSSLQHRHNFMPIAIETLRAWGPDALKLAGQIGRRISSITNDARATSFFIQRLSLAVQRGNAACILGTIPKMQGLPF